MRKKIRWTLRHHRGMLSGKRTDTGVQSNFTGKSQ